MSDPLLLIITLAIIVEAVIAALCAAANRRAYFARGEFESIVWERLVAADFRAVIAGGLVLIITVYALIRIVWEWPPLPPPWAGLALAAALALLLYGPIANYWLRRRIEKSAHESGDDAELEVSE